MDWFITCLGGRRWLNASKENLNRGDGHWLEKLRCLYEPITCTACRVIWGESLRGAECKVRVPLLPDGRVSEGSNFVKERDQAEDDLNAEGVDTELCVNNGLRDSTLASDNAPEKQGLNYVCAQSDYNKLDPQIVEA